MYYAYVRGGDKSDDKWTIDGVLRASMKCLLTLFPYLTYDKYSKITLLLLLKIFPSQDVPT